MLRIFILFSVCILHTIASWCQEVSVTAYDVKCNGGSDGEVSISVNNSSNRYTLKIIRESDNRTLQLQQFASDTTISYSNFFAGKYVLEIVSNADTILKNFIVDEPARLVANKIEVIAMPSSAKTCNGILKVNPSGGTAPYSYKWNDGSSKEAILGDACCRVHRCKIYDANNCGPIEIAHPLFLNMKAQTKKKN